ncbi:DNA (cytosine-5-)-methyltransferase [Argonema antarcticum]|uniref:DNA (cytosine-5-)-methyltransferase n=1 Tax=Argonema antarcticum TaxID=2942763 RepID=UPI0020126288|nr:DNA (cytosine-5-)-methyltransferase [Argonema antarcticum]MCL1474128.1 DNA cytosine methyltransferase [Argonema antarcticum A004/B2]
MKGITKNVYYIKQLELFHPFKFTFERFNFTFVDLFAGIGGFRIALSELGGKCLGYSEIDKAAIKVYERNFITDSNSEDISLGDIRNIDKFPFPVDVVVGGVPCQPWSVAGKLKGFDDPRGELWFDTLRVVKINQPKVFIFENVKGLIEPLNKKSFEYLVRSFQEIGYCVKWRLLNSYDFGLPQNRERVFLVGIRKDLDNNQKFSFPEPLEIKPKLYSFIDGVKDCSNFNKNKIDTQILFGDKIPRSRNRFQKDDELNDFFIFCDTRDGHSTIHSWDIIGTSKREKLICHTILKNRRKKKYGLKDGNPLSFEDLAELIPNIKKEELDKLIKKNIVRYVENQGYEFVNSKNSTGINGVYRIFLPHSDIIPTLTATGNKDYVAKISLEGCQDPSEYKQKFISEIYKKKKFKPISAKDAGKLQGFPDRFIMAENEDVAKKQFGNAVPVPVVYHLMKSLLDQVDYDTHSDRI